jgi:predicted enzyme related to lactoylglutathione lyase
MFRKVAFTSYPVRDVARARNFYEQIFGLKPGLTGNRGDIWWVEYDLPGGGCFAISNANQDAPSASAGGTIAFEVEDLTRLIAELKAKQVEFKSGIIHGPRCRMAVCLDSEGNSIVLHQLNSAK